MPYREVGDLEDLTVDEHAELWSTVTDCVRAIKAAYRPHGLNVGINLGAAAGAGIPSHLHVHVHAPVGRRLELHDVGGRDPGPAGIAAGHLAQIACGVARATTMNGMAADEEIRDELPEDLDASNFVGPYMFPNNNRRRIPAVLYGVMGLGAIAAVGAHPQ